MKGVEIEVITGVCNNAEGSKGYLKDGRAYFTSGHCYTDCPWGKKGCSINEIGYRVINNYNRNGVNS